MEIMMGENSPYKSWEHHSLTEGREDPHVADVDGYIHGAEAEY